jgi:hypothetical protein
VCFFYVHAHKTRLQRKEETQIRVSQILFTPIALSRRIYLRPLHSRSKGGVAVIFGSHQRKKPHSLSPSECAVTHKYIGAHVRNSGEKFKWKATTKSPPWEKSHDALFFRDRNFYQQHPSSPVGTALLSLHNYSHKMLQSPSPPPHL